MTYFYLTVMYIHVTLEVRIPSVCPTAGQTEGNFQGPKIFNALSSEIQNVSSIAVFTSELKTFFLE